VGGGTKGCIRVKGVTPIVARTVPFGDAGRGGVA
jgi:hypothetical protein